MNGRLARACAIVAIALAAVLAIDGAGGRGGFSDGCDRGDRECETERAGMAEGRSAGDAAAVLSIDDLADARGFVRAVPEAFAREAFGIGGFDEALASEDGTIVGMVGEGRADETFIRLSSELADKGWTPVESGQAHVGTFVKTGGAYGWLLLSCSEAGGLVSVVAQVR